MNQNEECVQSPCVENCSLNKENVCLGCFRSLAEIAHWQEMDDSMRIEVLHRAEKRRKSTFNLEPE